MLHLMLHLAIHLAIQLTLQVMHQVMLQVMLQGADSVEVLAIGSWLLADTWLLATPLFYWLMAIDYSLFHGTRTQNFSLLTLGICIQYYTLQVKKIFPSQKQFPPAENRGCHIVLAFFFP